MKIKNTQTKYWLILVVATLLIFLHYSKVLRPLELGLISLAKPILGLGYQASTDLNLAYNQATADIDWQARAKQLEADNKALVLANAQLQYLKAENETLRQYLNFFDEVHYNFLPARVISRQLAINDITEHNQLLINKGSRHGLVVGLAAVDAAGLVIGRVIEANKDWSVVALVTSPHCHLAVSLQPETKVMGVAQGEAGLTVKINFIPQDVSVTKGGLVITSGLEENIPPALVIGKVKEITKESNELWQNAQVEPLGQLDNLSIISVILPQTISQ